MEALLYICAALLMVAGVATMVYGMLRFYKSYIFGPMVEDREFRLMKKYRTMALCGIAAAVLGMAIYLITKYFI